MGDAFLSQADPPSLFSYLPDNLPLIAENSDLRSIYWSPACVALLDALCTTARSPEHNQHGVNCRL
jgi:hypothetical protein